MCSDTINCYVGQSILTDGTPFCCFGWFTNNVPLLIVFASMARSHLLLFINNNICLYLCKTHHLCPLLPLQHGRKYPNPNKIWVTHSLTPSSLASLHGQTVSQNKPKTNDSLSKRVHKRQQASRNCKQLGRDWSPTGKRTGGGQTGQLSRTPGDRGKRQ